MSSDTGGDSAMQVDSEDELDWEEVQVPEQPRHLEITLDSKPKEETKANKKKGISHAERLLRIDCHKMHTIALIVNARVRNKWINDPLLHARLLSLVPLHLQNSFSSITKARVPDQDQRGRIFERALVQLTKWWSETFFEVIPDGHIRNITFDEIQSKLEIRGLHIQSEDGSDNIIDVETLEDIVGDEAETIRSSKSLMKHALMQSGSRDTSAQLFTSLCRGMGIPSRLVVSIQSVPWQSSIGKPKPKYERKKPPATENLHTGPAITVEESSLASEDANMAIGGDNGRRLDGAPVPVMSEKAKGKQKAQPTRTVKLRKAKDRGNVLGAPSTPRRMLRPDPLTTAPVFWTEVFSRPEGRWIPVDPIRNTVNKRKTFDPSLPATTGTTQYKVENRMVYVLAFEEDGYARDVTRRYAKEYGAKIAKMQGGSSAPNMRGGGRGAQAWWDRLVVVVHRPFRLHRDDVEDQELDASQMREKMPATMSGFKDHPLYVLERHLKQNETIHPPPPETTELGKFKGEPVYPRSAVVSLKTAENWMRTTGRSVREGEQAMKMVKVRAGTVNRMRELEVLKDELRVAGESADTENGASSGIEIMQGLYAFAQTEAYVPKPVVDGKVPKNDFGNIDLYVPSMLPNGAAHVPYKGVAKIARKLGFDFAEAVTGFEFKKRRAFPIIEGVVVARENEGALLEAFWEAEREANVKAQIKKEDRVLKQWTRLIHGLRIRQKLQEQYGNKSSGQTPASRSKTSADESSEDVIQDVEPNTGGGFIAEADRIVSAFRLPKNEYATVSKTGDVIPPLHAPSRHKRVVNIEQENGPELAAPALHTYDLDDAMIVDDPQLSLSIIPKTMRQMAEDEAVSSVVPADEDIQVEDFTIGSSCSAPTTSGRPRRKVVHKGKELIISNGNLSIPANASPDVLSVARRGAGDKNPRSSRLRSSNKRKHSGGDSYDTETSEEEDTYLGGTDDEVLSSDPQEEDREYTASPRKRKGTTQNGQKGRKIVLKSSTTRSVPTPSPTANPNQRTLRPRVRKTA